MVTAIPKFVKERLSELARRVRIPNILARVWERQLTNEERQRVTASDARYLNAIQLWVDLRGVHPDQAVIQIARANCLLLADEAEELSRHLGFTDSSSDPPPAKLVPHFTEDGKLKYDNRVIRVVPQRGKCKTKAEQLFRAFQDAQWAREIDNPFKSKHRDYLHNAIRQANLNLGEIRFHSNRGARKVNWESIQPTAD